MPSAPGTYVGEGRQALSVKTSSSTGDLLVHDNETCEHAKVRFCFVSRSDGLRSLKALDATKPPRSRLRRPSARPASP